MDYITTTQLRTKTSQLVSELKKGKKVSLMHRSLKVGEIGPVDATSKLFDAVKFKKIVSRLNLPRTTYKQREKIYREHMMRKYGKGLSRH